MSNNQSTQINAYTDADWVGSTIDRKSTAGYCTFVGGNLVTWKSEKQTVIARSSAEAEYRKMVATVCEPIWLKGLVSDLGFSHQAPMSLMCDNQLPCTLQLILFFMKEPSTSKWIFIMCVNKCKQRLFKLTMSEVLINLLTFSLNHCPCINFNVSWASLVPSICWIQLEGEYWKNGDGGY